MAGSAGRCISRMCDSVGGGRRRRVDLSISRLGKEGAVAGVVRHFPLLLRCRYGYAGSTRSPLHDSALHQVDTLQDVVTHRVVHLLYSAFIIKRTFLFSTASTPCHPRWPRGGPSRVTSPSGHLRLGLSDSHLHRPRAQSRAGGVHSLDTPRQYVDAAVPAVDEVSGHVDSQPRD